MKPYVKNRFVAGELDPAFHGQTQLEIYPQGLAQAENWFVDFRGGIMSRPGTAFANAVPTDNQAIRLFRFHSIDPDEFDILLIFGDEYIRFMRGGDYLLDNAVAITSLTNASPAVLTATAHGLETGDWVYLETAGMTEVNQRYFQITKLDADTVSLQNLFGADLDTGDFAAFTSGTFSRVSTLATPYSAEDLARLSVDQRFNFLNLYHPDYPEQVLERLLVPEGTPLTHQWTLTAAGYTSTLGRPTGLTSTPSAAGTASIGYIVTAVDYEGVESLPSVMKIETASVNFTSEAGSLALNWTRVPGARYYNVYRTLVLPGAADMSRAQQVGFIGRAFGTKLVDNNIIPDFTQSPPLRRRPFENGVVEIIDVTAEGSGYSETASTASITTSTGSGFIGYPVVVGGKIVAVVILDGGSDYLDTDTVVFSGGGGSGATADIVQVSPADGNNPATAAIFQGRRIYGGTRNSPMTITGSRPQGQFSNFDVSFIPLSSDAFSYTLDASDIEPIKFLLPVDDALMLFTSSEVRRLVPETGRSVSAVSAATELELANVIIGNLPPLSINNDVLIATDKGSAILALVFSQYTPKRFPQDISVLSGHLFKKSLVALDWAKEPFNLIYAVRDDGRMLLCTYAREHEVFGWCPQRTQGFFRDVCVVQEGLESRAYFVVERFVQGSWRRYIEYGARRNTNPADCYFGVDCGVSYQGSAPATPATLTLSAGEYIFHTDSSTFTSDMVGWKIRGNGGRFTITEYQSNLSVKVTMQEPSNDLPLPTDDVMLKERFPIGWMLCEPFTEVTGLDHLEGRTVTILGDGNVFPDQVVVGGKITLSHAVTSVVVGLSYRCVGKTLSLSDPSTIIDGKVKRYSGVAVRQNETRGLKLGTVLASLYELKETPTNYDEPIHLETGVRYISISSSVTRDDGLYFVQEYPLPASVLGLVIDAEAG
jgi:hypothetical protein